MATFASVRAFVSKWLRNLAPWGLAGASTVAVGELNEYGIAIGLLLVALLGFMVQIYDWKGIEGKRALTLACKSGFLTIATSTLALLAIVYVRLRGTKAWSNIETLDKVIVRLISDAGVLYNVTPWRLLGAFAGGCFLTLFIIWFQRKTESNALPLQHDEPLTKIQDKAFLECVATRHTKVSVAEKGGWTKLLKKPLDAVTLEFKNVTDHIFYPLVARIAFYRSDGQFCFQVNKAEWLEAGKVREVLLGVGASRELLVLWQLHTKETYASGESDRLDLGSCGNAIRAVVTFIAGRNETRLGEFEFEITLDPLSVKRQTETQNKSKERINEWLHSVAESDKAKIASLVRVPGIIYQPSFEKFYIDFGFSVFNNSLFDVQIENAVKGEIRYGEDNDGFDYPLKFLSDKPIQCKSRSGAYFVIRQPVRAEEVPRFRDSGNVLVWFHDLEIHFHGTIQFPEIDRTKLGVSHYLETKKRIWRDWNELDFIFGYTEEQWKEISSGSVKNWTEVERSRTEINLLKAASGTEALTETKTKPSLVFLKVEGALVYYNEINKKIVEYENKPRTATWRTQHPSFWILVAYYRNEPSEHRQPGPIQNVTAELTYNGTDDPYVVPRGLWFPENTSAIDIPYNDTRGVIIAGHSSTEKIYGQDKDGLVELGVKELTVDVRLFSGVDGAMIEGGKFKIESVENDRNGFDVHATKID